MCQIDLPAVIPTFFECYKIEEVRLDIKRVVRPRFHVTYELFLFVNTIVTIFVYSFHEGIEGTK